MKKCEAKHESKSEAEHESKSEAEINKLITIWVSSILDTPPLNSLPSEAKLI